MEEFSYADFSGRQLNRDDVVRMMFEHHFRVRRKILETDILGDVVDVFVHPVRSGLECEMSWTPHQRTSFIINCSDETDQRIAAIAILGAVESLLREHHRRS